jgi:hypothetical protein
MALAWEAKKTGDICLEIMVGIKSLYIPFQNKFP